MIYIILLGLILTILGIASLALKTDGDMSEKERVYTVLLLGVSVASITIIATKLGLLV